MNKFPNLKDPFHLIATLFGIGNIPFAPGTFGSIFAWILFIVISHFLDSTNMIVLCVFIIFISIWVCEKASKDLIERDHKSIVIDELAGMWLCLLPVLFLASSQQERIIYAALVLIFFRIFDILKPYPISYLDEKFKNGFGIVLDDLVAGIFALTITIAIASFLF